MRQEFRAGTKGQWLLAALAAAAQLGCSGYSAPSEPGGAGNNTMTVAVRNNLFDPATIEVPVNSTITWVWNSGGVEHNVTFQTGPSSGNLSSGSFPRTFQTAGSYPYICTIHGQGMSGVVNVTAGTGGGGGGGGNNGGGDGYGS